LIFSQAAGATYVLLPTPAPNDDRGGPQPNRRVLDIPPAGNERVIVR